MTDLACSGPQCTRPARRTSGLCKRHHLQQSAGRSLAPLRPDYPRNPDGSCLYEECARPAEARGYCGGHYAQVREGRPLKPLRQLQKGGAWRLQGGGYIGRSVVLVKGQRQTTEWQHRTVMEGILGRPLLPTESVHHKNGVRTDNRPENLELWSVSQPAGQRVTDKVKWAREILALYGKDDDE